MPLLRPREGDNDGGYAVADYGAVDPRVGTMADLQALAGDLHERGIALCVDVVSTTPPGSTSGPAGPWPASPATARCT